MKDQELIKCTTCKYSEHCDIQKVLLLYDEIENLYCSEAELH